MVVANFFAGLLVGTLLGLALAPVLRAWLAWKTVSDAAEADEPVRESRRTRVET